MDSELVLALGHGTWSHGSDTHTPTKADWLTNRAYVEDWWKAFPGDACEPSAVSASTAFTNGELTPCNQYQVYQGAGIRFVHNTSSSGN